MALNKTGHRSNGGPDSTKKATSSKVTKTSKTTKKTPKQQLSRKRKSINISEDDEASPDDDDSHTESADETRLQSHVEQSPEPDFILAEVTNEDPSDSKDAHIPPDLLHRLLHEQYQRSPEPKLATDAKQLLTKYFEVFVREAIARADYERNGGEEVQDPDDDSGIGGIVADEWLEVNHLEKIGAQLCLDF